MVDLEKVSLTGAHQTTLVTLYGKALDSRRPDSISPRYDDSAAACATTWGTPMPDPSAPIGGDKDIEDFARERGVGQQSINKLRKHLFGARVAKTCEYDSGSMYGNQPLCDREATHRVTYFDGSYGPFKVDVCRHHVNPTLGRAADPHGHGFTAETGG